MKVDTMRAIDHLAGVPLCFLSTYITKVINPIQKEVKKPEKVLFIELSEMGSTILADPAMRKLAEETGAELYFVIFEKNKGSLDLLKTIPEDNIFTISESGFFSLTRDTLRFLKWCREKDIDTVIDLELFSRFTALLTGYSGAVNRVGFYRFHNEGLFRGEMLTHRVAYNPHIHISKNFMALINSLLADDEEIPYSKTLISDEDIKLSKVYFSDEEKLGMREKIRGIYPELGEKRIVLVNPNASDLLPQRRWMPEYFKELIQMMLAEREDTVFLITGAPSERSEAAELEKNVGSSRCINFAGKVKFSELPLLYSVSSFMVTNDSGPGHFAAITDMPTFVFFGPETPKLYGSLGDTTPIYAGLACSPCVSASNHRKTPCDDNRCLQVIKPADAFGVIAPKLRSI
ncbi:glycosyltransferase family 9 protein [Limisalsivibrio acetivorans]|uniref:glycosyltransferase family 9 protein n=1 Tax=Limisalsivibrio acetivorans TaxID=1304888 RepID=UPI0003B3A828|nr:glycosyltransferase family 9 protein [Limisalsivibrio acetivorans]